MRKTLLAVGVAVLVSMMLAPHGGKRGVEGWGPFFSAQGLDVSRGVWDGNAGNVMIDMLALEMVFLSVLFALVVNIRWRRPVEKNGKPTPTTTPLSANAPPPTSPQKETEPNSMKAVAKALDGIDHQRGAPNAEGKTTPGASTTKGTGKKSLWRLIGGCLLLAGASNSLRNLPPTFRSHDLDYKIAYFVFGLLLAGVGAWLIVSYLSKRPRRALLILSVVWLLVVAAMVYTVQKSAESNKQFGNAMRGFANDAQHYIEAGGTGTPPTFKTPADADNDLFARVMNDLSREIYPVIARMNAELNSLGEKDVMRLLFLTNTTRLETEARKRIEGQRIIDKYRHDLPGAFETFRQKLASYNVPDAQKKNAVAGFEDARAYFSQKSETMFNLLGKKEETELDFLRFMDGTFNDYELKDGKISFHNPMARQTYQGLTKNIDDTAKQIAAFRKEQLDGVNANIQKLSR